MVLASNEGQTSQLQQILMRFVDDLSRAKLGEISGSNQDENEKESPKSIEITKNGQVITKGTIDAQGQLNIDPKNAQTDHIMGQVEILRELPIGTTVPSAKNIKVEVETNRGKKTLLATDENGKITVNALKQSEMKSGLDSVKEQINQLSPKVAEPMKLMLEMMQQQQESQRQMMAQIETLTQEKQELLKASQERGSQPRNPRWWQKAKDNVASKVEKWWKDRQARKWAKALKTLLEEKGIDNQYTSRDYLLKKTQLDDGSQTYQLMNRQETENRLQFKINSQGKIEIHVNRLDEIDEEKIAQLQKGSSPSAFKTPKEIQLQESRKRQQNIVFKLLSSNQIERGRQYGGKSSEYSYLITPRGDVTISANDGRGVILHHDAEGNNHFYHLNNSDLAKIEGKLFPRQTASEQTINLQKQKTMGGRGR